MQCTQGVTVGISIHEWNSSVMWTGTQQVVTRKDGEEWSYIPGRNSRVMCAGGYTLHIRDTEGTLIEDTVPRYTQGKEASYPQWTAKKEKKMFLIYKEIQKGSGAKSYL